jgi:DNA-binding SARP family transcriptional activator
MRPNSLAALAEALNLHVDQAADLAKAAAADRPAPELASVPHPRAAVLASPAAPVPAGHDRGLWLATLGPLEAWQHGTVLPLGPPARRTVLGLLVLAQGALVRRDAIIDALWGDEPPPTALGLLQAHVSRTRKLLEHGPGGHRVLESAGGAYRLALSAGELDLLAFRDLATRAAAAQADHDPAAAAELYDQAMALWQGDPLSNVDALREHPRLIALKQELAGVLLRYAEVASALGQPYRVLPRLRALAGAEPLNELAHARLVIALAGAGQQAAAIRVYEDMRLRLDRELGLYPGYELSKAYLRVLRGDVHGGTEWRPRAPAATAAPATPPAPRQLPAAPRHFTGRPRELRHLSRLLKRASGKASEAVIVALTGMAGIGKTAAAVHWGHRVAGQFPDGQLFADLRGSSSSGAPVTPAEALGSFLAALGAPAAQVPVDLDGRAALFRTMLASRRMLIVLDNARDPEQVRPLLPGSPGCVTLVTSRNRLTGLAAAQGAHLITLGVLTDAESRDLLSASLGGQRAAAEPAAVGELFALCGRLPLALCDVSARAVARPGLPLSLLVTEMRDGRRRLDALETGEPATSVRVVFSWSRAKLGEPASRMFRLLGIYPSPDITVTVAACLAGISREQASLALTEVCDEHLLTEISPGRYRSHDLLHTYAAERTRSSESQGERDAAVRRVLDYYLNAVRAAAALLFPFHLEAIQSPLQPGVVLEEISAPRQAEEWLENERHALLALMSQATEEDHAPYAWELPWAAGWYFHAESHRRRLVAVQEAALRLALERGNLAAQVVARQHLGWLGLLLGDVADACDHLDAAAELAGQLGDGRLRALVGLSCAYFLHTQGRTLEATAKARHALRSYSSAPGQRPETSILRIIGWHFIQLREYRPGSDFTNQAITLYREAHRESLGAADR